MKRITMGLLGILVSTLLFAGQQGVQSIQNFLHVNPDFCTGGQPTIEHLTALKAEGVTTIINLRTPQEYDPAPEEAKAKELGLRYFNIPVANSGPKDEQAAQFLTLTDDPKNRPAFIHCASANRVGAFWMIRRVLRDNWTVENAKAEAQKIGLRAQPLMDFATQYIEKNRKK